MTVLTISNNRGPLRVSTENGRYLTDNSGRPIYLAGFHTWYNVQDGGPTDPPGAFDWDEYLQALVDYGCNFTKLWASMETAQLWADPLGGVANPQYFSPPRYERTGPGNAADGKLKFDLTQINQEFLDRLYERVTQCAQSGIYVVVQLFQGWQIERKGGTDNPWTYHPYDAANNINSIDGDQDNDSDGTETHTDASNVVLSYQEDLVEAIVTLLNPFDNVIWEISNEDTGSVNNTDWQEYMIDFIATTEGGLSRQHLIGRTVCYPNGSNDALDASDAKWVSYSHRNVVSGTKVSLSDSDHIEGITADHEWIWIALCNGHGGSWYMDEWANEVYGTGDRRNNATYMLIRDNLGYALAQFDLLRKPQLMTPQAALCTTGFCLARDHATAAEYVCFQDGTGNFNLNLSTATGTLNIRWLRCSDGTVSTDTVSGGATRTLTPPWAGAVVAYVFH